MMHIDCGRLWTTLLAATCSLLYSFTALAHGPKASTGPEAYIGSTLSPITFNAGGSSNIDSVAAIKRYLWDFGDGSDIVDSGTSPSAEHQYQITGTYTVTVAVTDEAELTGAAASVVFINDMVGNPVNGKSLYQKFCETCHGVEGTGAAGPSDLYPNPQVPGVNIGPNGDGRGTSWTVIKASLIPGTGVPFMITAVNTALSNEERGPLTDLELQDIASYLSGNSGGIGTGTITGESIYAGKCAFCHGTGGLGGDPESIVDPFVAGPGIVGVNVDEIKNALGNGSMDNVSAQEAEITLLAGYLNNIVHPTDAPILYKALCSRCHGYDALGGAESAQVAGPGLLAVSEQDIATVLGTGSMIGISATTGEIQLLHTYLTTIAKPGSGSGLYRGLCARCHGTNAWGENLNSVLHPGPGILGASVSDITGALNAVSEMGTLPEFSDGEKAAIVEYLGTLPKPITGADIYTAVCSRCHGLNARGGASSTQTVGPGILGITAAEIQNALSLPVMSTISAFSNDELVAVQDFILSLQKPNTGQGLFNGFCTRCHGVDATGSTSALVDGGAIQCRDVEDLVASIYGDLAGNLPVTAMIPLQNKVTAGTQNDFQLLEDHLTAIGDTLSQPGTRLVCPVLP